MKIFIVKLITLKSFDNPIQAHMLKSKLESEEILCFLFDENIMTLNPLYNISTGGIKLKINESDLDKAVSILQTLESTEFTNEQNEPIQCPNCQSTNIYNDFKSMKGLKGALSWLASLILFVFPVFIKTIYRCKSCDFEFKTPLTKSAS